MKPVKWYKHDALKARIGKAAQLSGSNKTKDPFMLQSVQNWIYKLVYRPWKIAPFPRF